VERPVNGFKAQDVILDVAENQLADRLDNEIREYQPTA